ncbi:MAG: DUF3575 domain-containing protein [Sphingobacteriales bacterium]|nr:MAG: DUF3575 domain-containing protein [Sphingobacteriales bacterium]
MKLHLTAFFLFSTTLLFAQRVTNEKEKYGDFNVIKINLSALTTGTYSFQYERALSNHTSLLLAAKFRPSAGLPFKSTIKSFLDTLSQGAGIDFVNNAKIGSYAITPEIRFYLGKGAMHGFYLAPFARYEGNKLNSWRYTLKTVNKTIVIDFTGKQNGIGAGLQIGAQYMLSNKISLDIWLVGPYLFADKIDANSITDLSDKTDQDLQDAKNDIEKYAKNYLPGHTVTANVTHTGATLNAKGTFYGARALGLAIGYRF